MQAIMRILNEPKSRWILLAGLIVQLITAFTAIGYFHPDQHFQIIEFASSIKHPSSVPFLPWEFEAQIRPSFLVYVYFAYDAFCGLMGLNDPYAKLTLLRLLTALGSFLLFNGIIAHVFRKDLRILNLTLFLNNFIWLLPFMRSLFSSEIMSSLLFFGALFWLRGHERKGKTSLFTTVSVGFLLSLSFYTRFQMGFALVGLGFWLLVFKRDKTTLLLGLSFGFLLGIVLNTCLDYLFYDHWVITPYRYFYENIIAGKADTFGRSSFWYYFIELLIIGIAPPISLLIGVLYYRSFFTKWKNPLVWVSFFFILGHSLVGHKEERFLFPIIQLFPVLVGFSIPFAFHRLKTMKKAWKVVIGGLLYFSLSLNLFALGVFMVLPYSQTIAFGKKVRDYMQPPEYQKTTVVCYNRTPLQTPSKLRLIFYEKGFKTKTMFEEVNGEELFTQQLFTEKPRFISGTYNQLKPLPDSTFQDYHPLFYSSELLWSINRFLESKGANTIEDIWILYERNDLKK